MKKLTVLFLCAAFFVTGCIQNENLIHSGSLPTLTKGTSPSAAQAILGAKPILSYQSKRLPAYSVQKYDISNGVQLDPYYLTFNNNKLAYWGYAHEHKRILGPLNRVMDEVLTVEAIARKKKAKKIPKTKKE